MPLRVRRDSMQCAPPISEISEALISHAMKLVIAGVPRSRELSCITGSFVCRLYSRGSGNLAMEGA